MPNALPRGTVIDMPNNSERMHAFWLDQLEEAASGLADEGDEWSASLLQRARGYARLGPLAVKGPEFERLNQLRATLRRQQRAGTGPVALALTKALVLLGGAEPA
jgi:hypothetical protein